MKTTYNDYIDIINKQKKEIDNLQIEIILLQKENKSLKNKIIRRNKRLVKQKHIYKVELGRCVRKLTRLYEYIHTLAYLRHEFNEDYPYPDDVVATYKNV